MFCVIQEIETKKNNKHGYSKEIITSFTESTLLGRYSWHYYSHECFERPVKKAYRISIHESYREGGKVRKRQFAICTARYYDMATDLFSLYDWGGSRIEAAAEALQVEEDVLYELIEKKLQPIQERVVEEFQQTEEYKVHEEHERITTIYAAKKAQFNEKYDLTGGEYDQCYDVYGNLHSPERLRKVEQDYLDRLEYERRSRQNSSSYYENFYNNYTGGGNSSYSNTLSGNYGKHDAGVLKKFYRVLSKKFHPDSNPDIDTAEEMKVLNHLKGEWGV